MQHDCKASPARRYPPGVEVRHEKNCASHDGGYSKSVEATWTFTGDGILCGNTDFPLRAQRIFAGN